LQGRREILRLFSALLQAVSATAGSFHRVQEKQLYGLGIGWVDALLLASSMLTACRLRSLDKVLVREASRLHLSSR